MAQNAVAASKAFAKNRFIGFPLLRGMHRRAMLECEI
jgi:hypothetical protein